MINAESIRACGSVHGIGELFRALGYPVDLQQIDVGDWRVDGIEAPEGVTVHHAIRYAGVDAYVFDDAASDARASVERFVLSMARRNYILKTVVIYRSEISDVISIYASSGRDKVRRLDLSLVRPHAESIDRLCALSLRGAGEVDARLLFERALDREAVGRRFFERFRRSVAQVRAALTETCPGEPPRTVADQALLLMSRILFLYFIQQKGWLDRNHRFLRDQLDRSLSSGASFHGVVLRPLFFDCLNTPVAERAGGALGLGAIPYLNGGLFEPSAFERRNPAYQLGNELWGDVLVGTFERFSFCVSEDDENGTHVDPEMLGKVFESLMEQSERAESGSFYTPKPLVDRLASAAILEWCAGGDARRRTMLESALAGDSVARHEPQVREEMLERLRAICILDPACGSGAFLLSSLRVVETLIRRLGQESGEAVARNLRQQIVERSLYGVDIKAEAVRLCELRLWLAIVSESSCDLATVPPLPNLDRNVLQGNSLISPLDFLGAGRAEIYRDWACALRGREQLLARYRHTTPDDRRAIIRAVRESDQRLSIALLERALDSDRSELGALRSPDPGLFGAVKADQDAIAAMESRMDETARILERVGRGEVDFFSFEVHFSHVLAKGGFDVAVGNPPWVRSSRIEPSARRLYADRYAFFRRRRARGFEQTELALAFCEKSLGLLRPGGVSAQLLPGKVMNAEYGAEMRKRLIETQRVVSIIDWTRNGKRLFGADVFPVGLIVAAAESRGGVVEIDDGRSRFHVEQVALSVAEPGSAWSMATPEVRRILEGVRERLAPLSTVLRRNPVMGVKTGANDLYFFDEVRIRPGAVHLARLGVDVPPSALVRCIRGRDLRRWAAWDSTWMLWPPPRGGMVPPWLGEVARASGIEASRLRLEYVRPEHLGIKVGWKDLSRGLKAAVLPASTSVAGEEFAVVPNQTVYSLDAASMEEAYVLAACLNSAVFNALAVERAEPAKDSHYRYLAATVGAVPMPVLEPDEEVFAALARLSRRAHVGVDVSREIDLIVAAAYGVSEGELDILSSYVSARLGEERG